MEVSRQLLHCFWVVLLLQSRVPVANSQTLRVQVDGVDLSTSEASDCSGGADPEWRVRFSIDSGSTFVQWNEGRQNIGSAGYQGISSAGLVTNGAAALNADFVLELDAFEDDDVTCDVPFNGGGPDDGECGGYGGTITTRFTDTAPCTNHEVEIIRSCSSDGSTIEWRAKVSYFYEYNHGSVINCNPDPPTPAPTRNPTRNPTNNPTPQPTNDPTPQPTPQPTDLPTASPSISPSSSPTRQPTTANPTANPTSDPTAEPTANPTHQPSPLPTASPTSGPTSSPTSTNQPTPEPTEEPTVSPSNSPTLSPSSAPTTPEPTREPTLEPTTQQPTVSPSASPSGSPTPLPTSDPTTLSPTVTGATTEPTLSPTTSAPTSAPSTENPTGSPTSAPSFAPTTATPTTAAPTDQPTDTTSPTTPIPTRSPVSAAPNDAFDGGAVIFVGAGCAALVGLGALVLLLVRQRRKGNGKREAMENKVTAAPPEGVGAATRNPFYVADSYGAGPPRQPPGPPPGF